MAYFCLHWRRRYLQSGTETEEWAQMNLESHARRFAQINPALRFIAFDVSDPDAIIAWQVTHCGQNRADAVILSALSARNAGQLINERFL